MFFNLAKPYNNAMQVAWELWLPEGTSAEHMDPFLTAPNCTQRTSWLHLTLRPATSGPVQVVREFRLPEGMSAEDMDSNGDGELLVALDLRSDDSLALRRVARELVNRVQKLRKVLTKDKAQNKNPVHVT